MLTSRHVPPRARALCRSTYSLLRVPPPGTCAQHGHVSDASANYARPTPKSKTNLGFFKHQLSRRAPVGLELFKVLSSAVTARAIHARRDAAKAHKRRDG